MTRKLGIIGKAAAVVACGLVWGAGGETGGVETLAGTDAELAVAVGDRPETLGTVRRVADELVQHLGQVPTQQLHHLATEIEVPVQEARFVRLNIRRTLGNSQPCIDELEIYGPESEVNLALAERGAIPSACSVIEGYPIHAIEHLNNGRYGNSHSWIAGTSGSAWAQIELPEPAEIARVVISRDRDGQYRDRIPLVVEVLLSSDGQAWHSAVTHDRAAAGGFPQRRNPLAAYDLRPFLPVERLQRQDWQGVVEYAFLRERATWSQIPADDHLSPLVTDRPAQPGGPPYWSRLARRDPWERVLVLFEELIERLDRDGLDVTAERQQLLQLRTAAADAGVPDDELYVQARWAKRQLFFRDPQLATLDRVLFAKRHPLLESHNYSEHLDGYMEPGGGIFVLHLPRDQHGRLAPAEATVERLFDGSRGIVRDPVIDYDAARVFFAYRPDEPLVEGWSSYWHMYSLAADGSDLRKLTDGPFHDFDPVVLPDGDLAFHTTRCKVRFLCWRPQAYVLYRMDREGGQMQRLSFANLSEWKPSIMQDGRILWTRSEYLDKGADFGHTLWAIRPDGTHPELIFGNNTPNCYSQAHEVPGTGEIVCTLMSHGDHQGPIALIDRNYGPFDTRAITNITPDTRPHYQMSRSHVNTFRDPHPVSDHHFLVAHNPDDQHNWGIYLLDRFGNRELLYVDPLISSKRPTLFRSRPRPPVVASSLDPELAAAGLGQFTVQNVYAGLGGAVAAGRVRYLRVAEEVAPALEPLSCGQYQDDHPPFQDFYAAPVHHVRGPAMSFLTRTQNAPLSGLRTGHNWPSRVAEQAPGLYQVTEVSGWPSYVAKTSHGLAPVAEDGSANFLAPAGRVLYFQLLDEQFNEIQRMRSVIQLQPGEKRSCVGCHEDRHGSPMASGLSLAMLRPADPLEPPPWGAVPFAYENVVQPVWDQHCVRCHDGAGDIGGPDLRGQRDAARVPASYRSLIQGGWVHYFDYLYGMRHFKAEPLSFGTLHSPLWNVLDDPNHRELGLSEDELRAVKAWIDLNVPLWPDYQYRLNRPVELE